MDKSMKRILASSITLLLVLAFLSACAPEPTTTTPTTSGTTTTETTVTPTTTKEVIDFGGKTIRLANWSASPWMGPGTEAEANYRAELQKKYNFKLEYLPLIDYNGDYMSAVVIPSIMAGAPIADIIYLMNDSVQPLAAKGVLTALDTLETFDFVNDFEISARVRDCLTWFDGHVYGFTFYRGGWELDNKIFTVFNKEIASQLGYDIYAMAQDGTWTWEKFMEAAAAGTQDTNNDGVMEKFGWAGDLNLVMMGYIGSTGHELLTAHFKVQYDNPNVLDSLTAFAAIKPYYNAPPEGANWDYYMLTFSEGNTFFDHGSQWWHVSRYAQMTADFGIVPFPFYKTGDPLRTISDIEGCNIFPAGIEDPELAAFVVKMLLAYRPWQLNEDGSLTEEFNGYDYFASTVRSRVRDAESINWLANIAKFSDYKLDKQRMYNIYLSNPGFSQMVSDVFSGVMTPAQAIEANQAPTQAKFGVYLAEISAK
jgi:multiple sugar transport system substrate-binding protein